eukprot:TRINITY_DN41547_c0_g1_i1.p1 TRINITY_DN41547_c0_g1~~TRINITY_DN41547_c0_g1_i1.p1  ORF type:complete len:325 (+),score=125.23 TRINITY_DN41547_c0_g1_i1:193-1167(+)
MRAAPASVQWRLLLLLAGSVGSNVSGLRLGEELQEADDASPAEMLSIAQERFEQAQRQESEALGRLAKVRLNQGSAMRAWKAAAQQNFYARVRHEADLDEQEQDARRQRREAKRTAWMAAVQQKRLDRQSRAQMQADKDKQYKELRGPYSQLDPVLIAMRKADIVKQRTSVDTVMKQDMQEVRELFEQFKDKEEEEAAEASRDEEVRSVRLAEDEAAVLAEVAAAPGTEDAAKNVLMELDADVKRKRSERANSYKHYSKSQKDRMALQRETDMDEEIRSIQQQAMVALAKLEGDYSVLQDQEKISQEPPPCSTAAPDPVATPCS